MRTGLRFFMTARKSSLQFSLCNSILHILVLQGMDGLYQLSQSKWLNSVFSTLEVDDCALGNCGLARKTCAR
jgi:hypothetical protein